MRVSCTIISICIFTFCSIAQIETDRPDFTESPNVVPKGALQIETGFVLENDVSDIGVETTNTTINTSLFRYGIADKTELRLNWAFNANKTVQDAGNCLSCDSLSSSETGFSPFFIGIKQNLHRGDRVAIGFLAHLYLPFTNTINDDELNFAPEFLLPISIDITDRFGIAVQFGMTWDGSEPSPTGLYTLALGYAITDQLSFYVEPYGYKGTYIPSGSYDRRLNGGFTYVIKDKLQLDLTGGFGYSDFAPDNFIGCGFSYLFQK